MARVQVFVDDQAVADFGDDNLVDVDVPWKQLLDHIEKYRIALIRAPPRSGKTMLGELASLGRVAEVRNRHYEVRYCSFADDYAGLLEKFGFTSVEAMAVHSGASAKTGKTIVYFFDEVEKLPEQIYKYFIKKLNGYAVFASTTHAPRAPSSITPSELQKRSFFYRSPAPERDIRDWLARRFAALFGKPLANKEVLMATKLLMGIAASHIGIIQCLGCRLEAASCRSLQDVRAVIGTVLRSDQDVLHAARCFGVANGSPTAAQSLLVSMLRCSGHVKYLDEHGCLRSGWMEQNVDHRRGLVRGLYAPEVRSMEPLVPFSGQEAMSFTHTLQPELYKSKFTVSDEWRQLSHEHRWVVNFSHSDTVDTGKVPTHVVDLVVSWLSHIQTADLVYARDKADANEFVFQRSLDEFCGLLKLKGRPETPCKAGQVTSFLDLLADDTMGIELLIRASSNNRYSARTLLEQGSATWSSLLEHISRTTGSYSGVAQQCNNGYITVLPATLTASTCEREWENFKTLIQRLRENSTTAPALAYHIMVAAAMPGWAEFAVFLHQPNRDPVQFRVLRQRLYLKFVNGELLSARHFYPRPETVWVQEITQQGEIVDEPFEVEPEKDSIASLRDAIMAKANIKTRRQPRIFKLTKAMTWEWIEAKSQVLYANTEETPYGFYVPQ